MQPQNRAVDGGEAAEPAEHWGVGVLHRASSRLLRTSSAAATGGAAIIPPAVPEPLSERTPLTAARRTAALGRVSRLLAEELAELAARHPGWAFLVLAVPLLLSLALIYLVVGAIYALVVYGHLRCDKPLKYYLLAVLIFNPLWTRLTAAAVSYLRHALSLRPGTLFCISMALGSPCSGIVVWGLYMVCTSETCHKTNPGLYYPTKHFVYGQLVTACISVVTSIVTVFGLRHLVLLLSTLDVQPGCQQAVRRLPRVSADSLDLIDPEDGETMECPICWESYEREASIVRAPCQHCFHEECLATWCKNHVACPLCRQQVGEFDVPEPPPA